MNFTKKNPISYVEHYVLEAFSPFQKQFGKFIFYEKSFKNDLIRSPGPNWDFNEPPVHHFFKFLNLEHFQNLEEVIFPPKE